MVPRSMFSFERSLKVGDRFLPFVEVGGLLVVVVQHLTDDVLVAGVAPWALYRLKVGLRNVFPAELEFLGAATTAFREARVADFSL